MQAVLWGKDHTEFDDVVCEPAGERAAVAITRGRHAKAYDYTDPNEDAAIAIAGPRATLLAVADGHNGWPATEAAISTIVDRLGDDPPPFVSDDEMVGLFHAASEAVLDVAMRAGSPNPDSRTTLVVGLLAGRRLQWASFGDSAVYSVTQAAAVALARPQHRFVGYPMPLPVVDLLLERGTVDLPDGAWVVLATDGFIDFARPFPTAVVAEGATAESVARGLVLAACDGGAGDNVAVAVAGP